MNSQSLSLLDAASLEELSSFEQLHIGFSGGLDSTVLLHFLANQSQFNGKLSAVHINHGLSSNANDWQRHCETICQNLAIPLHVEHVSFEQKSNLEARARQARRNIFAKLVHAKGCLLLGHHADDQAETVLLNLFRGAGVDGLVGMKRRSQLQQAVVIRPLLNISRSILKDYAHAHQLCWIEDESNEDERFSRNFIRRQVMPLLQKHWPSVTKNIARTSQHCFDAQHDLQQLAYLDCQQLLAAPTTLELKHIQHLPKSRLVNVLRIWLLLNQVRLPETEVMNRLLEDVCFARVDANPSITWDNICIRRHRFVLHLLPKMTELLPSEIIWSNFPKPLLLLNSTRKLQARSSRKGVRILPDDIVSVRFHQNSVRIRLHGQTKTLKKLWQQWSVPVWQRSQIPLLYVNDHLASIVGYAISDEFYGEDGEHLYELV